MLFIDGVGESYSGMDCSGLVRRALVDVMIRRGLITFNPDQFREGIFLWWNGCSAQELSNGYHGRTIAIGTASSINELDYSLIRPGDLAVTSDGRHVLAYLGEGEWISADPTYEPYPSLVVMKVSKRKVPVKKNFWFSVPIILVRWKVFDPLNGIVKFVH